MLNHTIYFSTFSYFFLSSIPSSISIYIMFFTTGTNISNSATYSLFSFYYSFIVLVYTFLKYVAKVWISECASWRSTTAFFPTYFCITVHVAFRHT